MERYYQPEIECASPEQIKAWQDERLVAQVKNVWDNVPHYRKKMEEKGLTPDDIKGKKRTKNIVFPRQVAMYLSRELTEMSFPKIGEEFGNKNHTTVIHAYEKIADEFETDSQVQNELNQLKQRLHR